MKIEAVIFDLGGTLIEYAGRYAVWPDLETPGLEAAYRVLDAKAVALPDFEKFSRSGFERLPLRWQMATSGDRNLRLIDFLAEILEACDAGHVKQAWLREAAAEYEKAICAQAIPMESAQQTLEQLKEHGYRIGLLSNTMFSGAAHIADLERFAMDSYFDALLFSADAGKWKPSPDPYLDLLAQLKTSPEQAVFVGDDPLNDMVGGQAAGLGTILMRANQRFHLPDDVKPDATITQLTELLDLLTGWSNEE